MAAPPDNENESRIAFGPFEFHRDAQDLRKHGTRIRLRGQPLRILDMLLREPGEIARREDLQKLLWNEKAFGDFEQGLNAAVNKLRQALGDSAEQPRYIETVPGLGYRFIAPVRSEESPPVQPQADAAGARPGARSVVAAAGLAIALAAVVAVLWLRLHRGPDAERKTVRFQVPIPSAIQLALSETFSLSPDGGTLVYPVRAQTGGLNLWVQPLNQLNPKPIPGTETESDAPPFWSPDNKWIVYSSHERLKKVGLSGTPPIEIARIPGAVLGGDWSRKGELLFGTETFGILRVAATGGNPAAVTRVEASRGERVHAWPSILPDGQHFIYSRIGNTETSGLYLRSVYAQPRDADLRKLISTPFRAQFVVLRDRQAILFQRDDTVYAQEFDTARLELKGLPVVVVGKVGRTRAFGFFSASGSGSLVHRDSPAEMGRFFWFDRDGKQLLAAAGRERIGASPQLAPDGRRFAISSAADSNTDIWVYDMDRGVQQRITTNPALDVSPAWSRDGKRIFFSSGRSGKYDIYQVDVDGNGREDLLYSSGENKFVSGVTPDGKFLLFEARTAAGTSDIRLLPLEGQGLRTPIAAVQTAASESGGVVSGDGQWIAYVSDESGMQEVYFRRFSPGEANLPVVKVSQGGGSQPHWRADGGELYYRTHDAKLMAVRVRAPALKAGPPQYLFALSGPRWDVSADGQRFLVNEPALKPPPPFVVVLDWAAEWPK